MSPRSWNQTQSQVQQNTDRSNKPKHAIPATPTKIINNKASTSLFLESKKNAQSSGIR